MSQDIIDAQQKQIEKLLKRLNELNNDHQALLDLNKIGKKTTSTSNKSSLFSKFGTGLKEKINNLTTPKNGNFRSVDQDITSDDSESERLVKPQNNNNQSDHEIAKLQLLYQSKKIQTITMLQKATTDVAVQTENTNDFTKDHHRKLMDDNKSLRKKYADLKQLYENILHKYSDYNSTIDIREGQIKDISMERNKLRKELKQAQQENANLMQVLAMKSKLLLDPDIKGSKSSSRRGSKDSTKSISDSGNQSLESNMNGTIISPNIGNGYQRSITTPNTEHKTNIFGKSKAFSLSPVLNVTTLFKPMQKKKNGMAKESVDIANKLMKVIQDKDAIIAGLQAQIKQQNSSYTSENE